jgi:16S rRNA (uracil1498-N3)-methyltransferase
MTDTRNLPRFFAAGPCTPGGECVLGAEQSRHMVRVLRVREGALVRVFTGRGDEFLARVELADVHGARLRVLEACASTAPTHAHVTLAFAPAPGNRTDLLIEKATELGAHRLQPIVCERLQRGQAAAAAQRVDRWQRKVSEAARQSQRTYVPDVGAPVAFEQFLRDCADPLRVVAANPQSPALMDVLSDGRRRPRAASLAVGPAGGFTRRELQMAAAAGFLPVSLGPHVLRVETAALCLLAGLMLHAARSDGPS